MNDSLEPQRHLYQTNGGAPWACATSVEEARERILNSEFADDVRELHEITQVPDDEPFTMEFDDVSPWLTADCAHDVDPEYFECIEDCGESRNAVTLPAGEWAKREHERDTNGVFGELDSNG